MSFFNVRDAATVHLSWGIYPRNLQKEELFQSQVTANTFTAALKSCCWAAPSCRPLLACQSVYPLSTTSSGKPYSLYNKQSGKAKMQSAFWALLHGFCRQQPVLSELLQPLQSAEKTLQMLPAPCCLCRDCWECNHNEAQGKRINMADKWTRNSTPRTHLFTSQSKIMCMKMSDKQLLAQYSSSLPELPALQGCHPAAAFSTVSEFERGFGRAVSWSFILFY